MTTGKAAFAGLVAETYISKVTALAHAWGLVAIAVGVCAVGACAALPTGDCQETATCAALHETRDGGLREGASSDEGGIVVNEPPGPACACLPPTPTGWFGPSLLLESTATSPTCPGSTTPVPQNLVADLSVPSSLCDCKCGSPTGVTCPSLVTAKLGTIPCPLGDGGAAGYPDDQCIEVVAPQALEVLRVPASAGSCPTQPTRNIPATSWGKRGQLCRSSCEQLCAPQGEICIWQSGDSACPAAFPNKRPYFSGLSDTRSCSTCSCGGTFTCSGTITVYAAAACSNQSATYGPGTCNNTNAFSSVRANVSPPSATCTPTRSTPTGDASGTGPLTICCRT